MVGMTPWGVFFLACKLPYTKCWLLCQQAHGGQKSSEDKSISIYDCAEFATRPGTGEHPRPPAAPAVIAPQDCEAPPQVHGRA